MLEFSSAVLPAPSLYPELVWLVYDDALNYSSSHFSFCNVTCMPGETAFTVGVLGRLEQVSRDVGREDTCSCRTTADVGKWQRRHWHSIDQCWRWNDGDAGGLFSPPEVLSVSCRRAAAPLCMIAVTRPRLWASVLSGTGKLCDEYSLKTSYPYDFMPACFCLCFILSWDLFYLQYMQFIFILTAAFAATAATNTATTNYYCYSYYFGFYPCDPN